MTKPAVAIIILNYNGKRDSIDCLESLGRMSNRNFNFEIMLVDNGSVDKSVEIISNKYPMVSLIENHDNIGFSAGNNIGIKKALENGADLILLLNNDTIVHKDFLDELVVFAAANKKAGILGPALKFKKGFEVFYDLGGKLNSVFGRTTHQTVSLISGELPRRVDYVSGACMLIKSEVTRKIGLLDEPYFFGFEDVEYCYLARKNGFEVYNVPSSVVEHKVSASLGHNSPLKIYYLLRSNLRFIARQILFPKNLFGYLYLIVLSLKMFFNSPRYAISIMQAWVDFLRGNFGRKLA